MGLLSADEAAGISFLRSSSPIPDCRSGTPLRVIGTPTPISLADLIDFNGYAAQVTPPTDTVIPVTSWQAESYASSPSTTLAVGETRWVWVALRNTGERFLGGGGTSFLVGDGSTFADGLDGVGWPEAILPGETTVVRLKPGIGTGEVEAVGFRVRARTPGSYKLWLRTRDRDGGWLNASWVLVFTVI
jgi:hypothetical protein